MSAELPLRLRPVPLLTPSTVSDLREKFEVQLESGLDGFVVVDGLPIVTEDTRPKLVKFLKRKLDAVGLVKGDSIHMPLGADGKSEGYVLLVETTVQLR